ncbi:MAG TPA: hypothetical protein VH370_22525 [Humisphaera sp.]|jgi:hypothetical protein|nr:hypothetical protein [Humisphaera sp.]
MSTEPPVPPSAKSDLAGSRVLLLFVIALISVGALALTRYGWVDSNGALIAVFVGVFVALYVVEKVTGRRQRQMIVSVSRLPADASAGSRVLDYRTPQVGRRVDHLSPGTRSTVDMLKFFAGLGVGFGVIYVRLQGTSLLNESVVICLLLLMAAGCICLFFESSRTFGVGLMVSVPLAALVLVCLCFGAVGAMGSRPVPVHMP